jgi:Arc/MetJ-type ribon-helix-helix transcriptional regulator
MATVFFKINDVQEKEIRKLMEEEGYGSKSEFFRFLVKFFKYHKTPEEGRFEKTTQELAAILKKLEKQGKLDSSIDEQLKDV